MSSREQQGRALGSVLLAGAPSHLLRVLDEQDAPRHVAFLECDGCLDAPGDGLIGRRHPGHRAESAEQRGNLAVAQRADEHVHLETQQRCSTSSPASVSPWSAVAAPRYVPAQMRTASAWAISATLIASPAMAMVPASSQRLHRSRESRRYTVARSSLGPRGASITIAAWYSASSSSVRPWSCKHAPSRCLQRAANAGSSPGMTTAIASRKQRSAAVGWLLRHNDSPSRQSTRPRSAKSPMYGSTRM